MKSFISLTKFSKIPFSSLNPKAISTLSHSMIYRSQFRCTTYIFYRNKLDALNQGFSDIEKDLLKNINKTDPKEIITILGQAVESSSGSPELWKSAEKRIINEFDQLSSLDLSLLADLFGRSKQGTKEFWFNLERACLEDMAEGNLNNSELARIIEGFAHSENASTTFWERINTRVLEIQDNFNAESISLVISGYGEFFKKTGFVDKPILDSLRNCVIKNFPNLTLSDVVLAIEGFGRMHYNDPTLWSRFNDYINKSLPQLSDSSFVTCVQSFARVEKGNEELWKGFKDLLRHKIERLDTNQLSRVVWCFAKISFGDENLWKLFRQIVNEKLSQFNDYELIKIIWSFAYIQQGDDQFWQTCAERIGMSTFGQNLNSYDYYSLLWSFSESKRSNQGFWFKMADRVIKAGDSFDKEDKLRIHQLFKNNNIHMAELDKVLGV